MRAAVRAVAGPTRAPAGMGRRATPTAVVFLLSLLALGVGVGLGGCTADETGDGAADAGDPSDDPGAEAAATLEGLTREAGGIRLVLTDVDVPTDALLQAVSPVDEDVVWMSGHRGVWVRSEDGGSTWRTGGSPGGDTLEFRDVAAFGPGTAYLMSAGYGEVSRVYRTDDGGESWDLQFMASDSSEFLSCMSFWDESTGFVYGDEFDGSLYLLRTEDGGSTWTRLPPSALPEAQEGEGGFAASGTCARAGEGDRGWIATGNGERARILTSDDRGRTWTAMEAPVAGGTMAGLFTVEVRGSRGIALGGAVGADTARGRYVAVSEDGGRTWREGGSLAKPGAVYGAAFVPGIDAPLVVAVGPGGIDWSPDGGDTWHHADDRTHWAIAFGPDGVGWASGPGGLVTRIEVARDATE